MKCERMFNCFPPHKYNRSSETDLRAMNTYEQAMERLENIHGVFDVEDGSVSRFTAVDFKLFPLERMTDNSYILFGPGGYRYKGGMIRLPRIRKERFSESEAKSHVRGSFRPVLQEAAEIRLEPELDNLEDDYYIHVEHEPDNGSWEYFIKIVKDSSKRYSPR